LVRAVADIVRARLAATAVNDSGLAAEKLH